MSFITVEPWPNGLGHTVSLGDQKIAEIFDPPERRGVKVTTFDAQGEPDLVLDHPFKVPPLQAVGLCFILGMPASEYQAPRFDLAAMRERHGEKAVLLLDHGNAVHCLPDQRELLSAQGVPEVFPREDLEEVTLRLIGEGLKVVLCPRKEDEQP